MNKHVIEGGDALLYVTVAMNGKAKTVKFFVASTPIRGSSHKNLRTFKPLLT